MLGDLPAPSKARNVQRSVYHNFVAPLVLYGVLGAVTWRNRRHQALEEEGQR